MKKIKSKTIVFITGAFVNHSCWDNWITFFEDKGYSCIAPPWPGKDADAQTLRSRHPDRALASVTLEDIVNHYKAIVAALPECPILIGHSFGGLISQVLMNQGMADAVVAIHAAPPKGVIPYEWEFLKSNTKALGYFTSSNDTYLISFKSWQYVFTNDMELDDQKNAYYSYAIPESKRAIRGGLSDAAAVDFKKPHAPLLFLAGDRDHCIPAHLCERVFKRYKHKSSITEFKLKDRNHFILGLPTWREDAGDVLGWLNKY